MILLKTFLYQERQSQDIFLILKEAGLIRDEREGKFIYYELNTTVLEEIMLWMSELKGE